MKKYNSRKDVPLKYQWDLTFLYETDEKWQEEYDYVEKNLDKIASYSGKITNPDSLAEYLELDTKLGCMVMDLYVYAMTKLDEDLSNSKYQEMLGKADIIENKYNIAISFFEPELLSMSEEEYNKLYEEDNLKSSLLIGVKSETAAVAMKIS